MFRDYAPIVIIYGLYDNAKIIRIKLLNLTVPP